MKRKSLSSVLCFGRCEAWEDLYDQYCEENNRIISAIYWSCKSINGVLKCKYEADSFKELFELLMEKPKMKTKNS